MAGLLASVLSFIDWSWIGANGAMIRGDLLQHLELSGIAIAGGLALSFPLAVLAWWHRGTRTVVLAATGLLYTIPSIALFVLIQPLTGYFSLLTAEVALVGYTLLILVRNLLTGFDQVSDEVQEAARALGYTPFEQLLRVYFPLALPSLFAGLRVATVTVIGLVTITAFVGWGGLGLLIVYGFGNNFFTTPIWVGLVLSIALAASGDAAFVLLERVVVRWSRVRV
jgi:osmoprotectant transport system permease protein